MMLKIALSSIKSVSRSSFIHDFIIQIQKTCIDIHPKGGELNSLKACSVLGPLKNKNTHTSAPGPMLNGPKNQTKPRRCHPETFQGWPEVELGGLKQQMVDGKKRNKDCSKDLFGSFPKKVGGGPQMNIGEFISPHDI